MQLLFYNKKNLVFAKCHSYILLLFIIKVKHKFQFFIENIIFDILQFANSLKFQFTVIIVVFFVL